MRDADSDVTDDSTLIDMDTTSGCPPGCTERGDTWRTTRIYQCDICGVETNKWTCGGWPGKGPRLICPAHSTAHHDELEVLVAERDDIYRRRELARRTADTTAAGRFDDQFEADREVIDARIDTLRQRLGAYDDVVGIDGECEVRSFTPSGECRPASNDCPYAARYDIDPSITLSPDALPTASEPAIDALTYLNWAARSESIDEDVAIATAVEYTVGLENYLEATVRNDREREIQAHIEEIRDAIPGLDRL